MNYVLQSRIVDDMFIEKVDKDKYPQATQEYRLEIMEVVKV